MPRSILRALPAILTVTAAFSAASPTVPALAAGCPGFRSAATTGHVKGLSSIREISGVVASRRYAKTLWIEQDGGNPERIDAVRPDGTARTSIAVKNAKNHDWEDIAFWDRRIWVGDIGDNGSKRDSIAAYWFKEPRLSARSVTAKIVTLRYPDGAHNAEAMFVTGGNLFVVSKEKTLTTGTVYRADVSPLRDGATRMMQKVATVPIGNISAADVGARGIVIRNYRHGLLYRWRGDHRVATALGGAPCDVEVGPGAESIAFATWNRSTYSIPEGTAPPVFVNRPR
jgi:hypothetical protein